MAFDAFMYFDGNNADTIKGETTDNVYKAKHAFEIHSFSWGASNPTTVGSAGGGMGAGKVSLSSFNIMKKSDAASPALFLACCNGTHIGAGHVVLRKAGGKNPVEYLTYDFTEVMVESIQWSGSSGGDDTPAESVSFAFGKFEGKYTPQDATGTKGTPVPFSWDVIKNSSE
jgi:type VI secretion system secreted protein Hcp